MDALDTNVLARYYVDDDDDEQSRVQRHVARALIEAGTPLFVPKTVILELEWVLRGYYGADREALAAVLGHLLSLSHVEVEDRAAVSTAADLLSEGFDFADALHHASSRRCQRLLTFDDRGFARKANRLGLQPRERVPD